MRILQQISQKLIPLSARSWTSLHDVPREGPHFPPPPSIPSTLQWELRVSGQPGPLPMHPHCYGCGHPLFYPGSMLLLHSSRPRILASLMVSEWSDASQSLGNEVSTPVLGVGGSGKGWGCSSNPITGSTGCNCPLSTFSA